MPKGLIEGLLTFLGILFFFVLPMIARARNAARRGGQLGRLRLERGLPRAPGVTEAEEEAEEEPEEEPVTATAAAPMPAAPRPAPLVRPHEPVLRPPAPAAALAAPGGLPLAAAGAAAGLRRLTPWQRAVVWAEILGPPRGQQ